VRDDLEAMMNNTFNSQPVAPGKSERDRGSVLTMVLALMVVGSLAVFALLNLATVLFMNRPPIEVRDRTFWSAKSAVSIAMVEQATFGPNGCYDDYKEFMLNGFASAVSCQADPPVTSGRGRYAIVTTSNDPNSSQLRGLGAGAAVKTISGKAFVNAGRIDATSVDLRVNGGVTLSTFTSAQSPTARYLDYTTPVFPTPPVPAGCATVPSILTQTAAGLPSPVSPVCVTAPTAPDTGISWQAYVGDRVDAATPRGYPTLPPLPPYTRSSVNQATVGTCKVFFPGQYNAPLTLAAGDYYFASGIYYFTDVVTLQPGAQVVAGQGKFDGCAFDAQAVYSNNAPKAHSVTGRGATFVFGGSGRLVAENASLQMNKRVSDSTTRGSEFTAFRSVNFRPTATPLPTTPTAVEIPDDVVMITDTHDPANPKCTASTTGQPCLQTARAYTSQASADAAVKFYTPSSVGVNNAIISITQTAGSADSNRFDVDGYTFVPNAQVLLNGGNNANYRTRIDGGIVASSLDMRYNVAPAIASNWFFGVQETNLEQRFNFYANVDAGNGQRTVSRATMQVDESGNYAINGWTVDPNAQGTAPSPPTTTTTTAPPTTTTTVPPPTTSSTTIPTTTTTTTTVPPTTTTTIPCPAAQTSWAGQYWNDSSPADRLVGTPDFTRTDAAVDFDWDNGSPGGTIGINDFSARWTRDVGFTQAGTYRFTMRGDDGMRLFIRNNTTGTRTMMSPAGAWSDQSATTYTFDVPLTACTHRIEFEFYENSGQASAQLSWVRL